MFNRFWAFGVHLLGSLVVALCCAALVFGMWYPGPLTLATGVTGIFLMLLAVDVVTGPFITLIVFNPKKEELKRDLGIVLVLQLSALLYGLHAVFVARPVYMVFNVDRFDLVFANDLTTDKLAKVTDPRFAAPRIWGPETIAALPPRDRQTRQDIMFSAAAGGDDLPQLPQYYVTYAELASTAISRVQTLDRLALVNPTKGEEVVALTAKYAARTAGVGYLPVRGKVMDLAAIVDRGSAEVLEVAALSPW